MRLITVVAILFLGSFMGFVPDGDTQERLYVTVSIPPQLYFVERIGGDHITASAMVHPGSDPHTYEPKPQDMVHLARSRIYFAIGVNFEDAWLERFRAVNPDMIVVFTDRGIEKVPMRDSHDSENQITRSTSHDRHIWLSPPLAMILARNVFSALAEIDPDHREDYRDRYKALLEDIADLDSELLRFFGTLNGSNAFMVFHPSWEYFARAYGLEQIPIEIEGKEPKPADIARLIKRAREKNISTVFVQPQLSSKSAQTIADAIHGQVIVADPLAEDWMQNLRNVAEKFREAVR